MRDEALPGTLRGSEQKVLALIPREPTPLAFEQLIQLFHQSRGFGWVLFRLDQNTEPIHFFSFFRGHPQAPSQTVYPSPCTWDAKPFSLRRAAEVFLFIRMLFSHSEIRLAHTRSDVAQIFLIGSKKFRLPRRHRSNLPDLHTGMLASFVLQAVGMKTRICNTLT